MGDSVNPGLFNPDFSGHERAGQAKGAALAGMGQDIGGAIKVHGENKKKVKKTEDLIKAVMNNFEGTAIGDQAGQMYQQFASGDISQRDQLAMGESIAEVLNIGLAGMDQRRADEMLNLRKAALAAQSAKGKAAPGMKIGPIQTFKTGSNEEKQFQVVSMGGQETMMTPEQAILLSRRIQESEGLSDMIKLPDQSWPGIPHQDPNAVIQDTLGVPSGSSLGVSRPEASGSTSLQNTTTFIDGEEVEATFNSKTGETNPKQSKGGGYVKVPKTERSSAQRERYEMLKEAVLKRTGRNDLTPAEEADLLEQAAKFDPLEAAISKAVRGAEGGSLKDKWKTYGNK